ncbi:MAG: DNA-directed RNA polymerase subunit alpha [Spirochaetaceae bacterium]|jgi:DNA-directed RNA polymerase subunit alpha|nr:DNA-directed RNA polymerase subunit alpha [Spirochaetaceae bacterium]
MARKNLLKGFKRPKGVLSFVQEQSESNYGKFTASPFEPGFGTTIGNTLRRVLLSSIQGYAISAVKIASYDAEGKQHNISSEFEPIPNIVEDTLEVINNMKKIRLRLTDTDLDSETVLYEWSGKKTVTSADFAIPGKVEVFGRPQHIMTLSAEAKVEFEVQVDFGRGYVPSETNAKFIEIIGTIPIDAIYAPVQKVKFAIQPCRIGQRNDYDKLVMEIWTDGTVRPDDALAEAAKIIKEHMQTFINFDEAGDAVVDDDVEGDEKMRKLLATPIEELDLTVRSRNGLERENVRTLGELMNMSEADLIRIPNFGKRSLQEIKDKLKEWNLELVGGLGQ